MTINNTIYALSTAMVKSAIAIVRVSGPHSFASLQRLTKKKIDHFPFNKMVLSNIYTSNDDILDIPLIVRFNEDKSYTGEKLVEYHIHGSIAVIKDLMYELSTFGDHRLAQNGEFTKRALENDKLNLIQVEGINDLINSQTSLQRKQAIREISGAIDAGYEQWYDDLQEILAFYEATIDFAEDEIPDDLFNTAKNKLLKIQSLILKEHVNSKKIVKIKEGVNLTIIGAPNVGKSSLINYLTNKDVAIVSQIAGTTRDLIEVSLDIAGYPVNISDTAGIRLDSNDEIEKEGIKRAISKAEDADIKIIMLDATRLEETFSAISSFIDFKEGIKIEENVFVLVNKIELSSSEKVLDFFVNKIDGYHLISVNNKIGMDELQSILVDKLAEITAILENPIVVQQRHNDIIKNCLNEIHLSIDHSDDVVIASYHLRNALNEIGIILGKVDIEEVLGIIFSNFCIGK